MPTGQVNAGRFKLKLGGDKAAPTQEQATASREHASSAVSEEQIAAFGAGAATRNVTPPPTSFFSLETEERGTQKELAIIKGKIRQGDVAKSCYLQIPPQTYTRLQDKMTGALAPGVVALVEFALNELERQGLTLRANNY